MPDTSLGYHMDKNPCPQDTYIPMEEEKQLTK